MKLWPRCRLKLSVLRWTRRTTDGRTDSGGGGEGASFFLGTNLSLSLSLSLSLALSFSLFFSLPSSLSLSPSLSAISSLALPSSARPCFPFSESDSPSPPILLPRFLLAICSGHIRRQCEEREQKMGWEERRRGKSRGNKNNHSEREGEPTKRPTSNTFSDRDAQGSSKVWRSRPRSSSPQVAWRSICPETWNQDGP